jgi:hypothetical protein
MEVSICCWVNGTDCEIEGAADCRHAFSEVEVEVSCSCRGAHYRMMRQDWTDASKPGNFKSKSNINVSVDRKKKGCLRILADITAMLICSGVQMFGGSKIMSRLT